MNIQLENKKNQVDKEVYRYLAGTTSGSASPLQPDVLFWWRIQLADRLQKPDGDQVDYQSSPSVAQEGKRHAGNWHDAHCHADVQKDVKEKHGHDTNGHHASRRLLSA